MSENKLPRRAILALCCFSMSTSNFLVVGPATCLSAIAGDLGLEHEMQKGLLLSAPFWGLGLMVLVSGWLADRLGFRLLLCTSALLQVAGLLLISIAEELWTAVAGGLLAGLGRGMVSAPLTALLCAVYPEDRTRMTGLLHAFYHIGMIFTLLMVLGLLQLEWEWRALFRLLSVLVLSYGLAALFLPLPGPLRPEEEEGRMPLRQVAGPPAFGLLLGCMFFSGITEIGPANWLPYFIEQATDSSQMLGVVGLLLFGTTMAVGRLTVSALVPRWGVKRFFTVAGSTCAVSLVLAALPVGTAFTVFWLMVLGLGISGSFPTLLGHAGDRFPQAGASMFAVLSGASLFGGVIAPMSVGLAADAFGLRPAMGLLAAAPLLLLVLLLMIKDQSG